MDVIENGLRFGGGLVTIWNGYAGHVFLNLRELRCSEEEVGPTNDADNPINLRRDLSTSER
jgi:hypothetical protein